MTSGRVFDIQRFSIHDGPGIRTTVFFKGCPLRCLWCGNPESIAREPSLSYIRDKCIACGACFPVCPEDAIAADGEGRAAIDRQRCTGCGKCPPACDPKALEMVGRTMRVEEVLDVVLRDEAFYKASGGGITLSGGEPLMQSDFALSLLREAKAESLHCTVETSGYAPWGSIRPLLEFVDLWLFDVKETDSRLHEQFTGKPNEMILANLRRLSDTGEEILIRCPMIPQHNARPGFLDELASLVQGLKVQGVELLPYYDLWRAKLERFGLSSDLPQSVKPPTAETVETWRERLRARGVNVVG